MAAAVCSNRRCLNAGKPSIKKGSRLGWRLSNGQRAELCAECGRAYEELRFCEVFHVNDSGWRTCNVCSKQLHCGCIVSIKTYYLMDAGGVECLACAKASTRLQGGFPYPAVLSSSLALLTESSGQPDEETQGGGNLDVLSKPSADESPNEVLNGETGDPMLPSNSALTVNGLSVPEGETEKLSVETLTSSPVAGLQAPQAPNAVSLMTQSRSPVDATMDASKPIQTFEFGRVKNAAINGNSADLEPLFEKLLSQSDAGRIGRLILPKVCAEQYFPNIPTSDGVPMIIQDITGRPWRFHFRFWPNNNSRIYVLEGVTACFQALHLQAGDTITFSRLRSTGQLVLGFRKAKHLKRSSDINGPEDPNGVKTARMQNGGATRAMYLAAGFDRPKVSGSGMRPVAKKPTGTWDEAQAMLQARADAQPTLILVDGFELEEHTEPPIFFGRSGTSSSSMQAENMVPEHDKWVQCDECSQWRRVPFHAAVPTQWACSSNLWDPARASCHIPQAMSDEGIDRLLETQAAQSLALTSSPAMPSINPPSASPLLILPSSQIPSLIPSPTTPLTHPTSSTEPFLQESETGQKSPERGQNSLERGQKSPETGQKSPEIGQKSSESGVPYVGTQVTTFSGQESTIPRLMGHLSSSSGTGASPECMDPTETLPRQSGSSEAEGIESTKEVSLVNPVNPVAKSPIDSVKEGRFCEECGGTLEIGSRVGNTCTRCLNWNTGET